MLLQREHSALLVIDVQQRLLAVMHEPERVVENCGWLLRLAERLAVPVLLSEQYPRGLGPTDERLRTLVPAAAIMEKLAFSCTGAADCSTRIEALERQQWVLAGIESHVCVLQTALGLRARGREVYVVAEAVSSRRPADRELAFARLRGAGVTIVGREMVAFEWLGSAGDDQFRTVSREFLR